MASLVDLFNPSFLMFLGILVLVVALLVVYFESKMREQNHKIASMLSLVSTVADDMSNVKMGLNQLALRGQHLGNNEQIVLQNNNLIEVSDGEEEDDDDGSNNNSETDSDSNSDSETDSDSDTDSETDSDLEDDIKVVKLQVLDEDEDDKSVMDLESTMDFEGLEDINSVDDLEQLGSLEQTGDLGQMDDLHSVGDLDHIQDIDVSYKLTEPTSELLEQSDLNDLKTISINLGDENKHQEENIDYKKLQLPKLRSIVIEKGLINNSDASKLKKHELLKLLDVE